MPAFAQKDESPAPQINAESSDGESSQGYVNLNTIRATGDHPALEDTQENPDLYAGGTSVVGAINVVTPTGRTSPLPAARLDADSSGQRRGHVPFGSVPTLLRSLSRLLPGFRHPGPRMAKHLLFGSRRLAPESASPSHRSGCGGTIQAECNRSPPTRRITMPPARPTLSIAMAMRVARSGRIAARRSDALRA